MPMRTDIETTLLDNRTAYVSGCTMRLYEGALPSGFQNVPAGLKLAELAVPNPSHNAATWNSAGGYAEATLRGTWGDTAADAGGTFGCFTVTDANGSIVQRGTAGRALTAEQVTAGVIPPQLIVSHATIAQDAPFSITAYRFESPPLP